MSHPIYYESITNEARLLEQLAFASKQYISVLRDLYPEIEEPPMVTRFSSEVMEYKNWLIETVSNSLISTATRIRVLQDSYDFSIEDNHKYDADKSAFESFENIVKVEYGEFTGSIRACCNKIIHATYYDLEFELDSFGTEYWTGWCVLDGSVYKNKKKKEWRIKLNAGHFSHAVRTYILIIKYL